MRQTVQRLHAIGTESTIPSIREHKILRFPRARSLLLNQQMIAIRGVRQKESTKTNDDAGHLWARLSEQLTNLLVLLGIFCQDFVKLLIDE